LIEEKVVENGVANKPFQYSFIILKVSSQGMLYPYKTTPTLGKPTKEDEKKKHKPKRYAKEFFFFFARRSVTRLMIVETIMQIFLEGRMLRNISQDRCKFRGTQKRRYVIQSMQ
jgi:hypothetical protein